MGSFGCQIMSGKILALEENDLRKAELKLALESPGHHLHSTESQYAALDYLKAHDVDLIICDVHLENASAFDFLRAVRAQQVSSRTPFVFYCIEPSTLTKSFVSSISVAAKKLGADDVIFLEQYNAGKLCTEVEKHLPAGVERKCAAA